MFAFLFTIILVIANIFFFIKKQYVYLFIPCILFLPQYYGIDFSSSLPLITFSRIMYLIFYIYALTNSRRSLHISDINLKEFKIEYRLISAYFLLRLISNLYYVTTYNQAINTICELIFEQLLFILAFYMLDLSKEEVYKLINIVLSIATLFYIFGVLESLTGIRAFDGLYTVSRVMINEHYVRMGLLRATTTFGMPGIYANMCVLMVPLALYMYTLTEYKCYIISIGLNVLAIIHSGSRADIFYLFAIFGFYFIFVINNKHNRLRFIKHSFTIIICLLLFISMASINSPKYKYFYVTTGKAALNELGFEFDLSEGAPSSSINYGVNSVRGSITRTSQFTAINYVFHNSPIFGMGVGAQVRGDVLFFWHEKWRPLHAYDSGIVEIFCDEGILGLLGITSLIISLLMLSKKHRIFTLMCITYLLTTFNTINMYYFLMFYLVLLLNIKKKEPINY